MTRHVVRNDSPEQVTELQKSYWLHEKKREIVVADSSLEMEHGTDNKHVAVRIVSLSKIYGSSFFKKLYDCKLVWA